MVEVFGSDAQKDLERRAAHLWSVVQDDPRFFSHGRDVGDAYPSKDDVNLQASLAHLLGASGASGVPLECLEARTARLSAEGLNVDIYQLWTAAAPAIDIARKVLGQYDLPAGLSLSEVTPDTPPDLLEKVSEVTAECGVLLPRGAFMRGLERPAICLFAQTADGEPVATSAAVAQFHPDSPKGGVAWWGMLATRDAWRRKGLSFLLGAKAIVEMHERHGFTHFQTGIRADNVPSQKICGRLGLAPDGNHDVIAIDMAVLSGGRITK